MTNEAYLLSLISGLFGAVIGIVAQYLMQNQLQKRRLTYELKEKLIYEMQKFNGYIDHLEEISCDDEKEIENFTKNKNLFYSQIGLLHQYYSSFISAYFVYSMNAKGKLDFYGKIQKIQDDFLTSVYHCLFCPEKEARFNLRKIIKEYKELFENIMTQISNNIEKLDNTERRPTRQKINHS